ncbi:MAG: PhnD/SsuA/transferrin family substrate-binding protein, partial [Pseudomonadota bacterium]
MIASLPMYDPPHLRAVNDAFWSAIRAELPFESPAELCRESDLWPVWESPGLVLSQTCGLPFRAHLHSKVHLILTPDYGLPECPPGYYNSTIITRIGMGDLTGARLAYNDTLSQSGWAAAQGHGFAPHLDTGAHAASLSAVASGAADVAVVDSHTLRILGLPGGLETRGLTEPTPGLPFITARADWIAPLRAAIPAAFEKLPEDMRAALGIKGFVRIDAATYQ